MRSARYELPAGWPLAGIVSVPTQTPTLRAPLLVFLHGLDEGPPTEPRVGLTRHGPLRPGSARIAQEQFVVLAPQLPKRGDHWRAYAAEVELLVEHAFARWPIDPDRTYLTGFSFGGNGVFDLALLSPERWAALWAVDPTRVPARDPGLPTWLSVGDAARRAEPDFVERLQLEHSGFGIAHRVFHDDGLGHVETATAAYADAETYRWLLRHARTKAAAPFAHAAHTFRA